MHSVNIKNVAAKVANDRAEEYRRYHEEFVKKPLWMKLGLILWHIPSYVYYSFFASRDDRMIYSQTKKYLDSKQ